MSFGKRSIHSDQRQDLSKFMDLNNFRMSFGKRRKRGELIVGDDLLAYPQFMDKNSFKMSFGR